MGKLLVCGLLIAILSSLVLLKIRYSFSINIKEPFIKNIHDVYCLMITGKNDQRIEYAKVSIHNFLKQTYDKKHLIIINESERSCLEKEHTNVVELFVTKKLTLGAKRNMALKLVPNNSIWTTWDDDDWRSNDYLRTLYEKLMTHPQKNILMYCNRLEHNLNTNYTWRVNIPSGTYIFFGFQNTNIEYADLDTKEDSVVKKYIYNNPRNVVLFKDNDPKMYIRFVHKSNTSVYVNPKKNSVKGINTVLNPVHEFKATQDQIEYVNRIKKMYV